MHVREASDHAEAREHVERVVRETLARVAPERLMTAWWERRAGVVGTGRPVTLLAIGKASLGMADAYMERCGDRVTRGVVVTVPGHASRAAKLHARWPSLAIFEADHPIPTARNVVAAEAVRDAMRGAAGTSVVLLVSGGGSAHLTLPAPGVTLEDLAETTRLLQRAGATIAQLNAVRKHAERLKGGRLAIEAANASRIEVVVLSDVLGDPLDVIASGPAAPDGTTYRDAIAVLDGFVPTRRDTVRACIEAGVAENVPETPKPGDPIFAHVTHEVIGSNTHAVHAARDVLAGLGYRVIETRTGISGEASDVGAMLAEAAVVAARKSDGACAIVWGGETTVTVGEADGRGGRNQEAALAAALVLRRVDQHVAARITVASFGTDGVDGPTDAAGGVIHGSEQGSLGRLREAGVDAEDALRRHDSHAALRAAGGLIVTGPTGSNVNDVMLALVRPARSVL